MARVESGPGGSFIIYGKGHPKDGTLVQVDYDFPATAQEFGWSILQVQIDKQGKVVHLKKVSRGHSKVNCQHSGTDGTVDCKACGLKAGDFIAAAGEWLSERAE